MGLLETKTRTSFSSLFYDPGSGVEESTNQNSYYQRITMFQLTVLAFCWLPLSISTLTIEVYEYFHNVHNGNLSMAIAACEVRGGHLAMDPFLDDWDNEMITSKLDENILLSTYFSVSVSKTNGVWQYSDGTRVDMTSTKALTLREIDSGQYGRYDYDCALWNPWEPFFIPSKCTDSNAFICSIPVTYQTECNMETREGMRFAGAWEGTITYEVSISKEDCKAECAKNADQTNGKPLCWAAEYDSSLSRCKLLRSDEKPKGVLTIQNAAYKTIFMKSCKAIASFKEETCSVLCRCNTDLPVIIPTTKVEFEELLLEVAEQRKKELFMPTTNLSAQVRKKSSAKDSRGSSTGMGAMGITLMTLVFGSLFLLDMTSMYEGIRAILSKNNHLRSKLV